MANKPSRITFSFENLEHAIKQKGISIKRICEITDCSYENYKSWKKQGRINEKHLMAIAKSLNIDIDWLRGFEVRCKTTEAPKDRDYIRDKEGFVVPPYRKDSVHELVKKNAERSSLFLEWMYSEPLYDFVNDYLLKQGEAPIQKKAFNNHMKTLEVLLDGEVFGFLVKTISEDIITRRQRIPDFDNYLKSKK